jgi:SAM-dependent methyltransferase
VSDRPPVAPTEAIAEQYARRDAAVDAQRYSLFDAAALQAQQERLRAMRALWRRQGWAGLAGRSFTEVGCGSGGNLLDLLRLGADAQRLTGLELLPERVAAARACLPAAVRIELGDAAQAAVEPGSQDAVLAFTVFSSVLDDHQQQRWPRHVALGAPRRRGAVVRLHRGQSAQPRRARRAAGARAAAVPAGARLTACGASRWRRRWRGRPGRVHPGCTPALNRCCPCCAPTVLCLGDQTMTTPTSSRSCPSRCPRSATRRSPRWWTRCARAGSPPAPRPRASRRPLHTFLGDESLQCIAVNSATAGLHLALEALGIGPGDEVITTTHTFTATAEVVRYLGADVRLVDIDPATLNIDPAAVEAAITPRTKAILPVHYAGLAADMPALLAIAQRHGLKVVEDAAHALPTTWAARSWARSAATPPCSASTPTRPSPPAKAACWSRATRTGAPRAPCACTA